MLYTAVTLRNSTDGKVKRPAFLFPFQKDSDASKQD